MALKNITKWLGIFFGLCLLCGGDCHLAESKANPISVLIHAPPYTRITAEGFTVREDAANGTYGLLLKGQDTLPIEIRGSGPLGGTVTKKVESIEQLQSLTFQNGVIFDKDADPVNISVIPQLCPRLKIVEEASRLRFIYDAKKDRLNHIPIIQLRNIGEAKELSATLLDFDGKDVLQVKKIRLANDYEDASMVEYQGPDALTGKACTLKEGSGGFYANVNYAVIPYSPNIASLDTQTLLHLAQGSLRAIHKDDLKPELRTQAFLPGPFYSRSEYFYELCEWGDTRHQAAIQELEYENLAVWDWDYPVKNRDRVLLIVWEGDEEHLYPQIASLPPNYLIDDLIGVFEIARKDTIQPLTLRNESGDFEITVQSGDMSL